MNYGRRTDDRWSVHEYMAAVLYGDRPRPLELWLGVRIERPR